ncbi:MAG: DUF1569 domain-containing protein [Planctomycetaceae bacterium]|nr:DUF1569 domain-containing protein [Planctomycetaceae bacterium]
MPGHSTHDTRKITGRRELHFATLEDLRQDAEQLAGKETRVLGNWSQGQIYQHIAKALHLSIDGIDFRPPLWMRLLVPLVRSSMLRKTPKPGFQLPKTLEAKFLPDEHVTTEAGLADLIAAIERCQSTPDRATHFLFGKLTTEETNQFQLRHAELHLSFILPVE